jgi:PAS domain S-box-containing protein
MVSDGETQRELRRFYGADGACARADAFADPFAAAVRNSRMAMVVTDARAPDAPIVFVNDAFLELTGYGRDEVLGRNCRFLQGPGTDPETIEEIRHALAEGREVKVEVVNYRKDGAPFWNSLYLSPVLDDDGELAWWFGSLLDVTARKRSELELLQVKSGLERAVDERARDLQNALDQKTVLLHEVDHRVKNNLQLMSSLILLQMRRSVDPTVRAALQGVLDRATAIATVHRRLFQSEDVGRFDVADFIVDLTDDLGASAAGRGVEIELDLEPVSVSSGKAAPVALIVNELLANSLKHAFPDGRGGRVVVGLKHRENDYRICVSDDGVGADWSNRPQNSGGRYIVELLARQLRATTTWEEADPGTCVCVTMPVDGGAS